MAIRPVSSCVEVAALAELDFSALHGAKLSDRLAAAAVDVVKDVAVQVTDPCSIRVAITTRTAEDLAAGAFVYVLTGEAWTDSPE